MEALTRLVADSFARHGLDRPVDPRRLKWSRWFRCDSPHSLLVVPSKPGIFALAEEVAEANEALSRRMLAVLQFSEDDNMAFILDRMFAYANPMRSRLHSGNCFVRFVIIEDTDQRRTICAALNQWMRNSAEKASGLPGEFSSSLEFTTDRLHREAVERERVERAPSPPIAPTSSSNVPAMLDSGASSNLHCPPFPSGF